jgi:hypothetical protein
LIRVIKFISLDRICKKNIVDEEETVKGIFLINKGQVERLGILKVENSERRKIVKRRMEPVLAGIIPTIAAWAKNDVCWVSFVKMGKNE